MTNIDTDKQYIGVAKVARLLGVHTQTVKRIEPAKLPYFTVGSRGDRRYDPEDVERYIRDNRVA